MISDAMGVLKKNRLFAPLPSAELGLLMQDHQVMEFADGTELFHEGGRAEYLFLILTGEVVMVASAPGPRMGTIRLAQGDTVGEEAVLSQMPYRATARALSRTSVMAIQASGLMGHLESHFESAIVVISAMATHLHDRVREITELKMQSTAERLAGFLLTLAGSATGRTVVQLPFDKRHLADHLGMDPATLSRSFGKLRDKGVAANRTGKVEIEDVARLRSYGNGAAIFH
jgi:CRP/FNR family transcriptional regulator, dissimilatory nitrate respiration regulator